MNDLAAIQAVNAVLEDYYRGRIDAPEAIAQISRISGANLITHQESK